MFLYKKLFFIYKAPVKHIKQWILRYNKSFYSITNMKCRLHIFFGAFSSFSFDGSLMFFFIIVFRLKVLIRGLVSLVELKSGCEPDVSLMWWWCVEDLSWSCSQSSVLCSVVMWVMSRLSLYWRQSRPTLADNSQAPGHRNHSLCFLIPFRLIWPSQLI